MTLFGLSALTKRHPGSTWLQPFRQLLPQPSPAERTRLRRRANVHGGIELILLGLVLPLGYGALTMMMFNDFDPTTTALVLGGSLLCIGLGVTAIVRRGRD